MSPNQQNREPRPDRPEIEYWFFPRQDSGEEVTPYDLAMLNLPLPVRKPLFESPESYMAKSLASDRVALIENSTEVFADDAIRVLRIFGHDEAADWIQEKMGGDRIHPTDSLIFKLDDGQLLPASLAELLMPGLEDFDLS